MSNVVPIHGEGSWPATIAKLERDNAVYREALLRMCDVADGLKDELARFSHQFFVNEVDKLCDAAGDAIYTARLIGDA